MMLRVVLGAGVVISLGAAFFVACGGASSSDTTSGDGSTESLDGGNSTTDGQASNNNDSGGANDSGTTSGQEGGGSSPIDGGAPSDPGKVACGTGKPDCDTTTSYCCDVRYFDGGGSEMCNLNNVACTGGTSAHCDEAADCDGGLVCCTSFGGVGGAGSTCETSCKSGAAQLCRTEAECGDAGCSVLSCTGEVEEVCGKPIGCK